MNKSLLAALCLMVAGAAFQTYSMGGSGMSASQQDNCRKACMLRGDKWDPTSAASGKGCTCMSGEGNYTITDSEMNEKTLDNVTGKARQFLV